MKYKGAIRDFLYPSTITRALSQYIWKILLAGEMHEAFAGELKNMMVMNFALRLLKAIVM
jgi:hypothetical protein